MFRHVLSLSQLGCLLQNPCRTGNPKHSVRQNWFSPISATSFTLSGPEYLSSPQCINPNYSPPQDRGSEEYRHDLALLHGACARRLLRLCQSNGGVYVKAAQLLSTAQTVPAEYRTCVALFICLPQVAK